MGAKKRSSTNRSIAEAPENLVKMPGKPTMYELVRKSGIAAAG
jgi:hypothetical protein